MFVFKLEKTCIQTTAITKIVATENWLIKITPLTLFIAFQSDTTLVVKQADTHQISPVSSNEIQYVTIEVKPQRRDVNPFTIRINALDFKDLQDRVSRPISVLPNVKFHKTIVEQFVETFKEIVEKNPKYSTNQVSTTIIIMFFNFDFVIKFLAIRPMYWLFTNRT